MFFFFFFFLILQTFSWLDFHQNNQLPILTREQNKTSRANGKNAMEQFRTEMTMISQSMFGADGEVDVR